MLVFVVVFFFKFSVSQICCAVCLKVVVTYQNHSDKNEIRKHFQLKYVAALFSSFQRQ